MSAVSLKEFLIRHALATQTLLFLSLIFVLWFGEMIVSARSWRPKWRHSSVNLLLMLAVLPVQVVMAIFLSAAASLVAEKHWGLIQWVPGHESAWIRIPFLFLALDFLDYVYHRASHSVAGIWRFHRVHHCDQTMDVSTTVREHPGETVVRNVFLILWVFISGASLGILVLRQTVQTVFNILQHTHLRLPERGGHLFGWIFVTPNLHHVHHHYRLPHTDCNFGDVFSIWDRMFGTFSELRVEETVFGLDTHMDELRTSNFLAVARLPFEKAHWT